MSDVEHLPKRRLQLTLTLGADNLDYLASELRLIGQNLALDQRENRQIAAVGPGSGYRLTLTCDADMTAERFHEELRRWTYAQRGDPESRDHVDPA
jgi:hypothetical protein